MKEDYSSYVELPKHKNYKKGDKLTYQNELKTKLKLKDKVKGLDAIPPGKTAEFIKTKTGWEGKLVN